LFSVFLQSVQLTELAGSYNTYVNSLNRDQQLLYVPFFTKSQQHLLQTTAE